MNEPEDILMAQPMNWIVFLSDNHAHSALGCNSNTRIHTPALDSIARRGTIFENAYCASPLCCPSRAAIATGRFPHQSGYSDNTIAYDGKTPSWMRRARDAGHEVVSVGKLHYRSGDDDNGFSRELLPMHILNGRGGTSTLLRALDDEHPNDGQWDLYHADIGVGGTSYQQFDRDITRRAIEWLRHERPQNDKPWVLFVSYVSTHPPFKVAQHLLDLYDQDDMPVPACHKTIDRNAHPAAEHVRHIMKTKALDDPANLQRIAQHYYGLVTHLDTQIGEILAEVAALDIDGTRMMYTSDHGEMLGTQGQLGKFSMYEGSLRVPMIVSGPGIPEGARVKAPVSAVDIYPTLLDGLGLEMISADSDCRGASLFQDLDEDRSVFAEYHAAASRSGSFVIRRGAHKLIYHVGMAPELYDVVADPDEARDLSSCSDHAGIMRALTAELFAICNPEEVDARIKQRQRDEIEALGGVDAILADGFLVFSPTPGKSPNIRADTQTS